jgi:uncharacterized protein (DUF433 family)
MIAELTLEPEAPPLRTDDGGSIRVGSTRVALDSVVHAYQSGCTAEDIVRKYPTLNLSDVFLAVGYYLRHQTDVDAYLAARVERAEDLRREIQQAQPNEGIRERLLARKAKADR